MKSSVIVFPGSNCDRDIAVALEKLQFKNKMVWHKETSLPKSDLIVIPGGFSYGDYLRSGAIAGKSLYINAIDSLSKHNLLDKIKPVEEIETDVSSINTTEKTSKISYGLTYKERKNNKEYSNNNTKNTRKISVMSMSRSKK